MFRVGKTFRVFDRAAEFSAENINTPKSLGVSYTIFPLRLQILSRSMASIFVVLNSPSTVNFKRKRSCKERERERRSFYSWTWSMLYYRTHIDKRVIDVWWTLNRSINKFARPSQHKRYAHKPHGSPWATGHMCAPAQLYTQNKAQDVPKVRETILLSNQISNNRPSNTCIIITV
jgi:hypothetical protein